MAVRIDLRTRVLPHDHHVFLARPGQAYRLYPAFVEGSVVGPELPRLDLKSDQPIKEQPQIIARIRRSLAIRRWYRLGRPEHGVPSFDLADYDNKRISPSIGQFLGIVEGYFERAKKGDLVVVPPSAYGLDAYIGEFSDNPLSIDTLKRTERYGREPIPVRRVRWLTNLPKRALPDYYIELSQKPNAFVLIPRNQRDYVYRIAYGAYTMAGDYVAKFEVKKQTFTTEDDFAIQAFFNFVARNVRQFDAKSKTFYGIREEAFADLGAYAPELRTNVNSPGTLGLASTYITPLVASALLALALHVPPAKAVQAAKSGQLLLGNSRAPANDSCTAEVAEQVIHHLKMLGLDKWPEACEKARKAAESVGLQSPATAKEE